MAEETSSVKITQTMIYQKQIEMNDTQIKMLEKLDGLSDVPERIRELELTLARLAWVEKIAYTGLSAGLVSIIGLTISSIGK